MKLGVCRSSRSITASPTTKVVMVDGRLREFFGPVMPAQVLRRDDAGGCAVVCDADDLEFGDYVTAVPPGEELRPGGLYFVLPRSVLKRRLRPEEMVALAVKASAALGKVGAAAAAADVGAGRRGAAARLARLAPVGGFSVGAAAERRRGRGSGRSRNSTSRLDAISEERPCKDANLAVRLTASPCFDCRTVLSA